MSTTVSASQRRTSTQPTASQRTSTTFSTSRRSTTTSTSLRISSASPSASSTNFESNLSFLLLETATSSPIATSTNSSSDSSTTGAAAGVADVCSTNDDCGSGRTCSDAQCTGMNYGAPFGGPDSEPVSQLSTPAAVGIGVGVAVFAVLLAAFAFWFWRIRGIRPRLETIEAPTTNRTRSASSATDQKTLVASLPNSPRNPGFNEQQDMLPEFFAKALNFDDDGKGKTELARSTSWGNASQRTTEKALPPPPISENPLPPPPMELKRYAVNVNINKSMIFDDDMMSVVSPLRDSDTPRNSELSRERAPRYRFEEYLPPVVRTPPISVSRAPASNKRSSEYELVQYPNKRVLAATTSTENNDSGLDSVPQSPRNEALSKLESNAPQIPLPELPPPSPSFSFRSYDWYQDIIGEQQNPEPPTPTLPSRNPARSPTQATFPAALFLSPKRSDEDASLVPEPLSPAVSGLHLHPSSAAALSSPTSPNFRLSPTVYTMPSRPDLPPIPPTPPLRNSTRASVLSTMTRTTHNSRSWLPDEGLYLAEEGTHDSFKKFRRPSDQSRPSSYSPLM